MRQLGSEARRKAQLAQVIALRKGEPHIGRAVEAIFEAKNGGGIYQIRIALDRTTPLKELWSICGRHRIIVDIGEHPGSPVIEKLHKCSLLIAQRIVNTRGKVILSNPARISRSEVISSVGDVVGVLGAGKRLR